MMQPTESRNSPFEELVEVLPLNKPFHGDHWSIFETDLDVIGKMLCRINDAHALQPVRAMKDVPGVATYALPAGEPEAILMQWLAGADGLMAVMVEEPEVGLRMFSCHPFIRGGSAFEVTIMDIMIWPERLEAVIRGSICGDEIDLGFFDCMFAANRVCYKKGGSYRFTLVGIPYTIAVVTPEPVIISDPEAIIKQRRIFGEQLTEQNMHEPIVFDTSRMAAFFPTDCPSGDEYQFQGPVLEVEDYGRCMFGRRAWRVRVTIARPFFASADEDFDLDLFVTENALCGREPPRVGEMVGGEFWLQGYLRLPDDG